MIKKPNPIDLSAYQSHHSLGSDEKKTERIGKYLMRKGLIDENILNYVLEIQKSSNKILGEILLEEGFIPEELLQEYSLNRLFNPNRSLSLGLLLLETGKITKEQMDELILRHRQSGRALGAILIDEGIIKPQDFTQENIIKMLKISKKDTYE